MNGMTDAVAKLRSRVGDLKWAQEPILGKLSDRQLFFKIKEEAIACEGALDMMCKEYFFTEKKVAQKRGYDIAFPASQT